MWSNQATYCLHCESVGSGKDAQCVQCWMNLNDGWCHEPAGEKRNPRKSIYWVLCAHDLAPEWQLLTNPSYFGVSFVNVLIFLFQFSLFQIYHFWAITSEMVNYFIDYLMCLCRRGLDQCSAEYWLSWLQSAVFLIMSDLWFVLCVLRGMYEETLLEPDNRTWSTRESIRERMMCLDLTSFIHCALPVCLRSAL